MTKRCIHKDAICYYRYYSKNGDTCRAKHSWEGCSAISDKLGHISNHGRFKGE